jgi:hypothetical protein
MSCGCYHESSGGMVVSLMIRVVVVVFYVEHVIIVKIVAVISTISVITATGLQLRCIVGWAVG